MNPLKKKPRTGNNTAIPDKPDWLKVRLRFPVENDEVRTVRNTLDTRTLHTVCESASCPNLNQCWSRKAATYMIAGDICTRKCRYCDVASGKPLALDLEEPQKVAESAKLLGLRYIVLTSVNRDDLEDGGASHFARTIESIKTLLPKAKVEVLIPDFKGKQSALDILYASKPDIINHNIETVKSLFSHIAPQKDYHLSLKVLENAKSQGFRTKSGIMLGMGETIGEVKECIHDLRMAGTEILTLGQYLQPTKTHHPLVEYIKPEVFVELKEFSLQLGFLHVESGPLVRSSYHADYANSLPEKNQEL
ncbi:MAG: lipoyl synthase [Leptospiraceae bacterium]|nr:lipoyl synthase [Leptospiraceae bacterium]MCP5500189.1 lipoyl synthase [Leptospiraceae bacterium]